jgi:hypothetical protein
MESRIGVGFDGSGDLLKTTIANENILKDETKVFYKFSFYNSTNIHVLINGSTRIFLLSGQGFNSDITEPLIKSFVIEEVGSEYNWLGVYE